MDKDDHTELRLIVLSQEYFLLPSSIMKFPDEMCLKKSNYRVDVQDILV